MDNKVFDFHEIKTFADACEKLGMKEHLLTGSMGGDRETQGQAQALYKLLIIQKAMNNGVWRDKDGWSYLRRQFCFKLEASMVNRGDIVHASDDTLVKIHHIGARGEVYYEAYADNARGLLQYDPYTFHYGFITSCYPATEKQKRWLREWIKKYKRKEEKA